MNEVKTNMNMNKMNMKRGRLLFGKQHTVGQGLPSHLMYDGERVKDSENK